MPHESTVAHEQRFEIDSQILSRSRQSSVMDEKEAADARAAQSSKATKVSLQKL